jgi:predicted RNase H-like HicB family nuclease
MNKELIFNIEEDIEGGFIAKAIGHSIFAQGETMAELRTNIRDAVQCHFEEDETPKVIRLHIVNTQPYLQ